jgi:hypothetical protein
MTTKMVGAIECATSKAVKRVEDAVKVDCDEALAAIDSAREEAATKIGEMQKLLKAKTQLEVLRSEHTAQNHLGRVFCATCTEQSQCITDGRARGSKWLNSNGGYNQDSLLVQQWNKHAESDMHANCFAAAADARAAPLPTAFSKNLERQGAVATQLFLTAAHIDLEKMSHRGFERELVFSHLSGVDVGDVGHSRMTCREMSLATSEHGRSQTRDFATTNNPVTRRRPHVGSSIDKQSDNALAARD